MRGRPAVSAVALATLGFLYLPMLAVAAFSFNARRYGLAWGGFTFRWYAGLVENDLVLEAAWNTLVLALVSTALATVLGTLLGLGMERFPWPRRTARAVDLAVHLPVVTPDIILAVALVVALGLLRQASTVFDPGLPAMVIGHVTFQIAFVALVVKSRLAVLGSDVEEAARDLYASDLQLLRRVTLPLLAPGIVAGAMLAFTLSLDDFVISFFTAGPGSNTLPLVIYASVRRGLSPEIHALSTLVFLATVVLVLGTGRLARRSAREAS